MRRVLAPVAVGLVLVTAGCGGGGDDPAQIVRAAATRTADANSSRLELTVDVAGAQAGTVTASGTFDYESRRGTLSMDLSQVPNASGMGTLDAVVDGSVIYLRFPPEIAAQIPGGKPWVKIDIETAGRQAGLDVAQFGGFDQSDPTQALQYLEGASDDTTEVGEEDVRGTPTTHYRATLDLRKAADGLSGEAREAFESGIDELGVTKVPADIWVDEEGRARKLTYTVDVSEVSGGEADRVVVTMELFDFGVEVDASPPAADEVFDVSSFTGAGAG
jgi:hypothetical protein